MIDLVQIESAVRAQRGSWSTFFRREGAGWQCILYPRHLLTEEQYQTVAARLSAPAALTPADRKRNTIRAKSEAATRRAGGY